MKARFVIGVPYKDELIGHIMERVDDTKRFLSNCFSFNSILGIYTKVICTEKDIQKSKLPTGIDYILFLLYNPDRSSSFKSYNDIYAQYPIESRDITLFYKAVPYKDKLLVQAPEYYCKEVCDHNNEILNSSPYSETHLFHSIISRIGEIEEADEGVITNFGMKAK